MFSFGVIDAQFLGEQCWVYEWTMFNLLVNNAQFMSEQCLVQIHPPKEKNNYLVNYNIFLFH